jgi:plastocyanin
MSGAARRGNEMIRFTGRALTGALALALLWSTTGVVVGQDAERVLVTDTLTPAQLEIEQGTTVIWSNQDDERHRMRSKEGPVEFDSSNLEPGESFSFTFAVEGSYPYYDHRDRDGTAYFGMIIVGGASLDPNAPLPDTGSISIIDKSFRPGSVAVATGGTVEWSNDDGEAHTVTATDQGFDSGIMNGGASFSQAFTQPGSYPYFCLIHPEMRGMITVADRAEPAPDDVAPGEGQTDSAVSEADPTVAAPDLDAASSGLDAGSPTGASVSTIDRAFQPEAIGVTVGEAVSWTNDDTEGHTVTAADASFNSGIMTVGDEFSTTFETVGTFDYFCAIHPEMTGTVTVSEPAA